MKKLLKDRQTDNRRRKWLNGDARLERCSTPQARVRAAGPAPGGDLLIHARNSNPVLQATCYRIIEKHERLRGEPPTGVQFNKYLSLLRHELGHASESMGLPHCWYRWGDEVVRVLMPTQVAWDHTDPPKTKVAWEGDDPELSADDRQFTKMALIIDQLVRQYSPGEELPRMISKVYSYAPFPFQRAYRDLRETYLDIMGSQIPVEKIQGRLVLKALRAALVEFPHAEFPEFGRETDRFRRLMEHLIAADLEGIRLARETSEIFWFGFCYHLRLHPQAHENVPRSTLDYWRDCLPDHMNHYETSLNSIILEAGETVSNIREFDDFEDLFKRAEETEKEAEQVFADFALEAPNLGRFLDAMRSTRLASTG